MLLVCVGLDPEIQQQKWEVAQPSLSRPARGGQPSPVLAEALLGQEQALPNTATNSFFRESQEKVRENNSDFVFSFPSCEALDVKDISPLGKRDGSFPLPEGNLVKDHHLPENHLTSSPTEFPTYWCSAAQANTWIELPHRYREQHPSSCSSHRSILQVPNELSQEGWRPPPLHPQLCKVLGKGKELAGNLLPCCHVGLHRHPSSPQMS